MNEKVKDVEYSPLPMQEGDVEALHMHHHCRHKRRKMLKKLGLGAAITVFALTNLTSSPWSWRRNHGYSSYSDEDIQLYYPTELAEQNVPEPDTFVMKLAEMFPEPEFGCRHAHGGHPPPPPPGPPGPYDSDEDGPPGPPPHHGHGHGHGHHHHHHHHHGKHHGKHQGKHHGKHHGKHPEPEPEHPDDLDGENIDIMSPPFEAPNIDGSFDFYTWIDVDNLEQPTDILVPDEETEQLLDDEETFSILPIEPEEEFEEMLPFKNVENDFEEEFDEQPEDDEPSSPPHHPNRPRHPRFPGGGHGHGPHKRPHRHPHHGQCKDANLTSEVTKIDFSPDEFKRAALVVDGAFFGSKVEIAQASSDDVASDKVNVEVTILASTKDFVESVTISSFDHEGQYTVEVKGPHHPPHRRPHHPPHSPEDDSDDSEDKPKGPPPCLKARVKITFPAGMDFYEGLDLHLRAAYVTSDSLSDLKFGKFRAGVGRGRINLHDISAEEIHVAAVHGFISGSYKVSHSFGSGTIGGASKVFVTPTSDNVTVKANTIRGYAGVKVPADDYEGKFSVATFAGNPIVKAPNPADIHVTKLRPYLKAGYYKKESDSHIFVSATHGVAKLEFV